MAGKFGTRKGTVAGMSSLVYLKNDRRAVRVIVRDLRDAAVKAGGRLEVRYWGKVRQYFVVVETPTTISVIVRFEPSTGALESGASRWFERVLVAGGQPRMVAILVGCVLAFEIDPVGYVGVFERGAQFLNMEV